MSISGSVPKPHKFSYLSFSSLSFSHYLQNNEGVDFSCTSCPTYVVHPSRVRGVRQSDLDMLPCCYGSSWLFVIVFFVAWQLVAWTRWNVRPPLFRDMATIDPRNTKDHPIKSALYNAFVSMIREKKVVVTLFFFSFRLASLFFSTLDTHRMKPEQQRTRQWN